MKLNRKGSKSESSSEEVLDVFGLWLCLQLLLSCLWLRGFTLGDAQDLSSILLPDIEDPTTRCRA